MKRLIIFLSLFLLSAQLSWAQDYFTGTIEIRGYGINEAGEEELSDRLILMMNPDRLLISEFDGIDELDQLTNDSISYALIRHDNRDIVLYGGGNTALKIENDQIEALINMMGNLQQQIEEESEQHDQLDFSETGETKNIEGYRVSKWIITDQEEDVTHHVWLSDELRINWGLIAEDWLAQMTGYADMPLQEWMRDGNTPLVIERYEGDQLKDIIRMDRIAHNEVTASRLEIPENLEVVSLQQLIMEQFGGQ